MELDELKHAWTEAGGVLNRKDQDILELIQNKSAGPAEKLKRRFKRGLILMPLISCIAIRELSRRDGFMSRTLTWYFIGFCVIMMTYFYLNYRLMNRMQSFEGNVKDHLQKQVHLLKKGLKWRLLITKGLLIAIIILTELLMYFGKAPEFENWHHQNPLVRLGVYSLYLIFFYFLTKFATDLRYKKHIMHLQSLIQQMQ